LPYPEIRRLSPQPPRRRRRRRRRRRINLVAVVLLRTCYGTADTIDSATQLCTKVMIDALTRIMKLRLRFECGTTTRWSDVYITST